MHKYLQKYAEISANLPPKYAQILGNICSNMHKYLQNICSDMDKYLYKYMGALLTNGPLAPVSRGFRKKQANLRPKYAQISAKYMANIC